jgi:hypothetical protein
MASESGARLNVPKPLPQRLRPGNRLVPQPSARRRDYYVGSQSSQFTAATLMELKLAKYFLLFPRVLFKYDK